MNRLPDIGRGGGMSYLKDASLALLLAVLAAAIYAPSAGFDYVHYDDPQYTFANPHVSRGLSADGVWYAFTSNDLSNWHPLAWLSLMLDVHLSGMSPRAFHRTNVALHALSTAVLYLLLLSMAGSRWRAALATAVWSLHPLRVESVAWIAERKDVLSVFLGLLAMLMYVGYLRRNSLPLYTLSLLCFLLCLLAKPMLVTLPAVMLLIDYWPLKRLVARREIRRAVLEKLPFFMISGASVVMTMLAARRTGALHDVSRVPLGARISGAMVNYVQYLIDIVAPSGLAMLYPFERNISPATVLLCAGLLVSITILALAARSPLPNLLVGWLWFCGVLVPVSGVIFIGEIARADRYTYFSMIGILLMVVWSIPDPHSRAPRAALAGAAVAALLGFSLLTWRQLRVWADSETLFNHTLSVIGPHPTIHLNYGAFLDSKRRYADAAEQYRKLLELRPGLPIAMNNLGNTLFASGSAQDALEMYRRSLARDPKQPMTWFNMGVVYMSLRQWDDAARAYERSLQLDAGFEPARHNLEHVKRQGLRSTQN